MAKPFSLRITLVPPTKQIDSRNLSIELEALGLPNFRGISVLSRDVDAQGNPIKDQNRKPINVPRFLLIHSDSLSGPQEASVRTTVRNHVPPPLSTNADEAEKEYKSNPAWQAYIKFEAGQQGITEQAMIDLLKAQL